ncbi:rhodanese-like domain-containing protein [Haladaptatus sp. F3-133]|uniref:Rhodanese-like domain-containing protein n=1 Tax=Halorutilus salinus TaxID=2487751 RepID=A0A9Q4GI98_9EURY|nr:rhodanese-like domain-containing protein [Halorutilus salinus]MCX2818603.1 rhodanese-like domain-containing protein [Halorutilus salinus]
MVEEISADELEERLGDAQVLDVREEHELAQTEGRVVPGSTHVPMSRLPAEMDDHDWEDEICVICRHGNSSVQAVRLLMSYEGVPDDGTVVSVAGGYLDYDGKLVSAEDETAKAVAV